MFLHQQEKRWGVRARRGEAVLGADAYFDEQLYNVDSQHCPRKCIVEKGLPYTTGCLHNCKVKQCQDEEPSQSTDVRVRVRVRVRVKSNNARTKSLHKYRRYKSHKNIRTCERERAVGNIEGARE